MHHPEEAPPLNPWPFLVGDVLLLATAYLIGRQAPAPLGTGTLLAIVCCVGLGAVLATLPFLLSYTRQQDLLLSERQREIAALAQTTATSAEQISIAASSLHTLAENAARAVKLGEQLPQKMQDKINDFKAQLNEVAVTENESLAQEINTLRSSETERLETALNSVRKTAADLAMIEAVSRKHLSELNESLARSAAATQTAASESAKSIEAARVAAEKALTSGQQAAASALKNAVAAALGELEQRFAVLSGRLAAQLTQVEARELTRTESPAIPSHLPAPGVPSHTPVATAPLNRPAVLATEEPTAPVAPPASVEPTVTILDESKSAESSESHGPEATIALPPVEQPVRRRTPRRSVAPVQELTLGIELEPSNEFSQVAPDESTPAVSADGLTRVVVTAYIGIGNKLFVRGEGPGLSWERGVPLQFVSIGKWRWETADAIAPVTLKLYKNDEQESASGGTLTLTPGHQLDIRASFG